MEVGDLFTKKQRGDLGVLTSPPSPLFSFPLSPSRLPSPFDGLSDNLFDLPPLPMEDDDPPANFF